jgi:hypothetical protein
MASPVAVANNIKIYIKSLLSCVFTNCIDYPFGHTLYFAFILGGLKSSLHEFLAILFSEQCVEHYITTAPRTVGKIYYFQQLVTDGGSMYNSPNPTIMKSCLLISISLGKNCSYENSIHMPIHTYSLIPSNAASLTV